MGNHKTTQCFIQGGGGGGPGTPPPPPPPNSFPYTNFYNRIIYQLQSNVPIFFFKNVQNFIKINFT